MSEKHLFLSALAVSIEAYTAEKRAVGYKFERGADMLKRFDSFVHNCVTEAVLTKQLVTEWTVRKPNETVST